MNYFGELTLFSNQRCSAFVLLRTYQELITKDILAKLQKFVISFISTNNSYFTWEWVGEFSKV